MASVTTCLASRNEPDNSARIETEESFSRQIPALIFFRTGDHMNGGFSEDEGKGRGPSPSSFPI
ncbi:uncharacterized protein MEPE_02381 [Melanopsichium pennsylvanicum]|uniref:Uncharacterized protein n=1 Tax=Melanopsichium pennsylvanicum TaxID=63383 RepID=A0AAJ4XJU0_9BASI|nr:uncharacterized protein MEPE_02381 [Melanopsichium pennsylvanicum]